MAATLGVVANLSILAFFKYNHLVAASLGAQVGQIGSLGQALLLLPLPVGISFYTFHGISLVVDAWRGKVPKAEPFRPARHYRNTLLYIIFFPQLVAGPIVKAADFMPQIGWKKLDDVDWRTVFHHTVVGYFLKVVIADNLAQQTTFIACPACQNLSSIDLATLLVGYSVQIFADFCGYSSIAIGIAALLGYRLPINFNRPYIASSIADFWRRWHISLSSFLREYLYIPLGGNRRGPVRTYANLIVVMGLGGLWHGAEWSYAVWGLWHGVGLAVERACGGSEPTSRSFLLRAFRIAGVFVFVTLGWLLFKLPDFSDALQYLSAMATNTHIRPSLLRCLVIAAYALPVFAYHLLPSQRFGTVQRQMAVEGLLLGAIILNSGSSNAFIYFQF
ncbi:MBOAT family O-acyltransferase [Bosea sp. BH3]|uniref:MBOAT family O-acyltransferase n=1 Tax=Bosea sp. BH3 TaxID=2871701 RepID=UPI0021CB69F3|nr:MBOAT family O-acyltransferase [Bosea sp. BH3]MCU4180041.1 MBOAT family protein [Bosea sp. BH3]